jgi:DNA-binding MarR family transcriptional regulator
MVSASRGQLRLVAGALRELVFTVESSRNALAAELEVSTSEITALGHLHTDGALTPSDLGRRMDLTSGSVTSLLDRLEHAGLAVREPNPDDARSLLVHATPIGRHAVHGAYEEFEASVAGVLNRFPELGADVLAAFLSALSDELRNRQLSAGEA